MRPAGAYLAAHDERIRAESFLTRLPLRVLHVESGHEWRLTRNQVGLLVDGLRRVPHVRQTVATLERSRLERKTRDMGIPVISLPWSVGADPRALRTLARHARRRWDVVHVHDTHALRLMTYLAALEGSGSRIVATRRTVAPTRSAWKWRRAHLVLAVSESARDALDRRRSGARPNQRRTRGRRCGRPGEAGLHGSARHGGGETRSLIILRYS